MFRFTPCSFVRRSLVATLALFALASCDDDTEERSPPIEPWTGCVEPCTDAEVFEEQRFGRCAAHFLPADATVEAGGYGH